MEILVIVLKDAFSAASVMIFRKIEAGFRNCQVLNYMFPAHTAIV